MNKPKTCPTPGPANAWRRSREASSTYTPINAWRATLAQHLEQESQAAAALVFTCPAGHVRFAHGSVSPSRYQAGFEASFITRLLPRIERAENVPTHSADPLAYAPLELARNRRLAIQTQQQVLAPMGATSVVNAFLVGADGAIIGWLTVASSESTQAALDRIGPELTCVARIASQTLQTAIALASDCLALVPQHHPAVPLSPREQEIVQFVVSGLSNLNIAQRLGISEQTVGTHLRRIYEKLGVHSRVELVPFSCFRTERCGTPLGGLVD